jgi:peptidoglycan/xylan/chitin deacetylase (PgdA/CDA1 family)
LKSAGRRRVAEILWRTGALGAARRLRAGALGRPALVVLGYHRVALDAPPFSPLTLTPADFAIEIAHFARACDVWPLGRVAAWLAGRETLRRDTVVISFDDGYADNHRNAAPILERHGLPATFFVSTGAVRRGGHLWWDDLRAALEDGGARGTASAEAPAGNGALATGEAVGTLVRAYREDGGEGRRTIARRLLAALKHRPEAERDALVASLLCASAGRARAGEPVMMTPDDLVDLVRRGFEIGAHGVTHASLPTLAAHRLTEEVEGSLADLRALGIEPRAFAYPYGDAGLPGGPVEQALARAGVALAVTTEERPVRPGDAPLRLPRKVVPEQSPGALAARLERLAWQR